MTRSFKVPSTRIMYASAVEERGVNAGKLWNVTIAYRITETELGDNIEIATSWCSPNDQFCKASGRALATERLDRVGSMSVATTEKAGNLREITDVVLTALEDSGLDSHRPRRTHGYPLLRRSEALARTEAPDFFNALAALATLIGSYAQSEEAE